MKTRNNASGGYALITIDVDCMHGHTAQHGGRRHQRGREDRCIALSYRRWLPRYLEVLASVGVRSTFFLVADFARSPENRPLIQQLTAAGHEVASHSLTHRIELCSLSRSEKLREIVESKKILEDLSGQPVVGFRGPGYAFDAEMAQLLLEHGYWYDSSVVPGFLFPLYKRVRSLYDRWLTGQAIVHPNKPPQVAREPFIILTDHQRLLVELPLNVLPVLPYPFISYVFTSPAKFQYMYRLLRGRTPLVIHALHDFEFMDCSRPEEYVPSQAVAKMACQDLEARLALQRQIVSTLAGERQVVTAREYVAAFRQQAGSTIP